MTRYGKNDEVCDVCDLYILCHKKPSRFDKWLRKRMPKLWKLIKNL